MANSLNLFLVIGVDQEGDVQWDITRSVDEAFTRRNEMAETAHEAPVVYRITQGEGGHIVSYKLS